MILQLEHRGIKKRISVQMQTLHSIRFFSSLEQADSHTVFRNIKPKKNKKEECEEPEEEEEEKEGPNALMDTFKNNDSFYKNWARTILQWGKRVYIVWD